MPAPGECGDSGLKTVDRNLLFVMASAGPRAAPDIAMMTFRISSFSTCLNRGGVGARGALDIACSTGRS
jgi:hypothetical protein